MAQRHARADHLSRARWWEARSDDAVPDSDSRRNWWLYRLPSPREVDVLRRDTTTREKCATPTTPNAPPSPPRLRPAIARRILDDRARHRHGHHEHRRGPRDSEIEPLPIPGGRC